MDRAVHTRYWRERTVCNRTGWNQRGTTFHEMGLRSWLDRVPFEEFVVMLGQDAGPFYCHTGIEGVGTFQGSLRQKSWHFRWPHKHNVRHGQITVSTVGMKSLFVRERLMMVFFFKQFVVTCRKWDYLRTHGGWERLKNFISTSGSHRNVDQQIGTDDNKEYI